MKFISTPPWAIKAPMASKRSINACMSYLLLLALCVFSNDACRLLVQNMNDALGTAVNKGMHQYDRNSDNQTQYGGNQRLRNTARHCFGVTRTKHGDGLEGGDHTDHGTQQPHQRCNSSDNFEYGQTTFDGGALFQHRFFEFQLQSFVVDFWVVLGHFQHATQWVVGVGLARLQLSIHFGADTRENQNSPQTQQHTNNAYDGNHQTNSAAVSPLFSNSFFVNQGFQQSSAGWTSWVQTKGNQTTGCALQAAGAGSH